MSRKLLLADDSVTIQRVIELTFSGEDIQVLAVGDGEEAIARIPIEKPDIVLADIGMPKRSGYEVSAFVKGRPELAHIPVLLLAGAFEPVDDTKAQQAGCDGVLVKPFEPQHVIARVRELIGGAKGSPTQSAVQDIPRPAARLAPPRPVELPRREDRPAIPDDLMDVGESDLEPRREEEQPEEYAPAAPIILDDSLDDYFDKLDEAFAGLTGPSGSPVPAGTAQRPEPRAARPDGPVLERDLESFDEPSLTENSASRYPEPRREPSADPFAGTASIESPEETVVPTLDDLLAGMPPAAEPELIPSERPPAPVIDLPIPPPPVAVAPPIAVAPSSIKPPDITPTRAPAPAVVPVAPPQPVYSPPPPPSTFTPPQSEVTATSAVSGTTRSIIADAFSALLAVEQGEPGATPVRLGSNGSAPVVTDAMVDDVAKRVIERLALGSSDQMGTIVRQIVSDVAERLVREEIERIRGRQ